MEIAIIIAANVVMSVAVVGVITALMLASRLKPSDHGEGRAEWRGPPRPTPQ